MTGNDAWPRAGDRFRFVDDIYTVLGTVNEGDRSAFIENRSHDDIVTQNETSGRRWMFTREFLADCVVVVAIDGGAAPPVDTHPPAM